MTRLSARSTFFTKRVFPILWLGFMACFFIIAVVGKLNQNQFPFFIFLFAGAIGLLSMWRFLSVLADEVWDDGTSLIVKKGGQELRIPLADIINVNYAITGKSPRVTITLRHQTQLGKEIAFLPHRDFFSINLFSTRNRVIDALIERIDLARRK